jgi:hypothetical protein
MSTLLRYSAIALVVLGAVAGAALVRFGISPHRRWRHRARAARSGAVRGRHHTTEERPVAISRDVRCRLSLDQPLVCGTEENWLRSSFFSTIASAHALGDPHPAGSQGPDGKAVDRTASSGDRHQRAAAVKTAIEQKDAPVLGRAKGGARELLLLPQNVGKPYLRPMIPQTPTQSIINFEPDAAWPQ